jgi:Rha family phage regulatory protein
MELTIIKQSEAGASCAGAYIDSREVAAFIGKRHDHLLRDIAGYLRILEKIIAPNFGGNDFFVASEYKDSIGRTLPCYLLSKMGCELVANKLNGEKGVMFTAVYVAKFNALESAEREREMAAYNKPRLSEFNAAARNVLGGMSYACVNPDRVMSFLRGVYNPLGIEVREIGDEYGYLTVTQIARALGVYSENGLPHGHAIAAIVEKLEIGAGHSVIVPYGLVGFSFRYDCDVLEAVYNWLIENRFPHEVPHLNFDYHIYYYSQLSMFRGGGNDETINLDDDDWDFGDEE